MNTPNPQADHYNDILDDYDRHYYDRESLAYRERFILRPLTAGLSLDGKRVADIASGSGETSLYLMRTVPGIELTGFDVSPEACERYREKVGGPAYELDLTEGVYEGPSFDAAIVMGGLHHCLANLPAAIRTIARMVKPGGHLLMFEPNRDYFLEPARQLWYRRDRYFDAQSESALSHDRLVAASAGLFRPVDVRYFGGPAFFLVYNSLVFRLPHRVKQVVSPPLMTMEAAFNALPFRYLFASFRARWIRV